MARGTVLIIALLACAPRATVPGRTDLYGVVLDTAGATFAGARVLLVEADRSARADAEGRFVIERIDAARYTIVALAPDCLVAVGLLSLDRPGPVRVELHLERWPPEAFATRFSVVSDADWTEGAAIRVFDVAGSRRRAGGSVVDFLAREAPDVVQMVGGQPGGGVTVRGRATTLRGESQTPLILVDGVRLGGPQTTGAAGDPLRAIPMSDVRRIEILRGSSASALYGSDGAAGAIRITTSGASVAPPVTVPASLCPGAARALG